MSAGRLLYMRLAVLAALVCAGGILAYGISQETPVGALRGRAIAREIGVPVRADVYLSSVGKIEGEQRAYHTKSGADGTFMMSRVAAGTYTLQIRSKAHHMNPVRIGIAEGATQDIEAELQPDKPSLDLYVHQNVYTPDEAAQVTCHGFVDSDAFDVRLYKVDLDTFLIKKYGDLARLFGPYSWLDRDTQSGLNLNTNPALKLTQSLSVPITKRDVEGVFTQRITLPVLSPGLYITAVKAASLQRLGWVLVTSLGLVSKTVDAQTLVYAVDLKSGNPVSGASVNVYVASKVVASGATDANGLANLKLSNLTKGYYGQTIIARSGGSAAFVSAGLDSSPASNKTLYGYTDRPVYRPAQRVFYKGIIRDRLREGYALPKPEPVVVEVRDPSDTLIQRVTTSTDKFGAYSGSVYLDSEAPTGRYSITTNSGGEPIDEELGTGFSVAAYRKPEFSVKTKFSRRRYIRGDTVRANVSVNYYFGAPVANADVHYFIERSPYWLFEGEEDYAGEQGYSDYGGYGEFVTDGDVRTDSNGEAVIEFPADWPQPSRQDGYDTDQQFSVSVTVTDKAGVEATGDGSVIVTRGEFGIELTPDSYVVTPGSRTSIDVKAMDYDHHPVKQKAITVTLARQSWSDDGEVSVEKLAERRVVTDNKGDASVRLPISKTGGLLLTARSSDSRGNDIVSTQYLYSCRASDESCDFGPVGNVQIILDKKQYSPGDTARALILTKRPGGTALVTVEGDRVYDARTVQLKGSSSTVSIPITSEYRPNFYVAVSYIRNKRVATNQTGAKVSIKSQALSIKIEPNKRKYKPRDVADYKIKVTDAAGKPASAELSLGVVDEAIYAIQPDRTTPILDFFYSHRWNRVQTADSMPQIYLSDPDKAGPPASQPGVKIRVRKRFLDTAFWAPSVVTDSNGEANVSFEFPDNLTTWRTTVRGITLNTMCGQATNTVLEQQPMLVRLEMPRFLVQHDLTTLSAVVHNYTGKAQNVRVSIKSRGLSIKGDLSRSVFVRNDGSERLDWQVRAPRPGTFAVGVRAEGETAGDAVQLDLPVKPHGERSVTATNAVLSSGKQNQFSVYVRQDSIPESMRFRISLAPSLASTMFGSLEYLAQYPYGCTEQTASTFLPDVVLYRSLNSLGMKNARLQAELPDMVHKGLSRLYAFQLDDGGWSWCRYGQADPWMTAYVCYALIQAKQAGFAVNRQVLDSAKRWLAEQLPSHKIRIYPRAYIAYVLALDGSDTSYAMEEIARRHNINNEALAVLALGFQRLGMPDRAKAMLNRLYSQSISDGDIHWAGGGRGWDGGDIEPTALALQATLAVDPRDPRVYGIVRWLMKVRHDEYWESTRATAMALYAMSEFLRISRELTPDYTASVDVNGKTVATAHFDKASVFEPELRIDVPTDDMHKGRNAVTITKTGPGNLYYSTSLTQYVERRKMVAAVSGGGLTISREYFRPSSSYFQNGGNRDLGSPVSGCDVGQMVLVRLTIRATELQSHVLLEDNTPAGCEIVDRGDVSYYDWDHWWVGQDIRDDRISFYLDDVYRGKRVVEYQMRAGFAGAYSALPAEVFAMYDPSVRATTAETEFRIR